MGARDQVRSALWWGRCPGGLKHIMKRTGRLSSKLEFDGDIWTLEADADWQSVIHSCCEVWRMIDCYGGGLVQGPINSLLCARGYAFSYASTV